MKIGILNVLFSIIILSCCVKEESVKAKTIAGELSIKNEAKQGIIVKVHFGENIESFGFVGSTFSAVLGFADVPNTEEILVSWREEYEPEKWHEYSAAFDLKKLNSIADQIQGMQFVYLGNQKWKINLFNKPHREGFIKEIFSKNKYER